MPSVASSQAFCRRATRRAKSSFPLAFRVLSRPKRNAMTALYAFLRTTDDLADSPAEPATKRRQLTHWRDALTDALAGHYSHRVHAALVDAVRTYSIPTEHLYAVLDGVEMDLDPVSFASFAELYPYCFRVASAVGLACVPIWGVKAGADPKVIAPAAEAAGIAFQLTNILRDVAEDHAAGRLYLPLADLTEFGLTADSWLQPESRAAYLALMHKEAERAKSYYAEGAILDAHLTAEGRAIYGIMTKLYQTLLNQLMARQFDVFAGRVRIRRAVKVAAVVRAWPVKWGWL